MLVFKMTPVGERGWPDRLFIKDSQLLFVEFKAENGRLSALQLKRLQQLRKRNLMAVVIHRASDGYAAVDSLVQGSRSTSSDTRASRAPAKPSPD